MNIFSQIILAILLGIFIYYVAEGIMLLFCNKSLFCAKHTIKYVSKDVYVTYYHILKLINSGHAIPIYSSVYFCLSDLAERYHKGELKGYYFLVFYDGDIALYNEQGEIVLTSVWKPIMNDLVSKAGHSADDIKLYTSISRYYYKHGLNAFVKKFNIKHV